MLIIAKLKYHNGKKEPTAHNRTVYASPSVAARATPFVRFFFAAFGPPQPCGLLYGRAKMSYTAETLYAGMAGFLRRFSTRLLLWGKCGAKKVAVSWV
jgi:hypothetical protein